MKLDKDGKLEGVDDLKKAIEEKYSGFITEVKTGGADVSTPPNGSATKYESRKDIMAIKDTAERQEAIKNNPQLFS